MPMAEMIILFADNDRDFLDTRAEFLEAEGYHVLKAYSPEDAREMLDHRRVHLAILDIRLRDDSEGDISGLELAREEAYQALPKIMLTGFPTVEAVRVALKPRIDSLPPAVDYIPKKGEEGRKGPAVLIEAVEQAFAHHVRIDRDLLIRWGRQDELLAPTLVGLVHPGLPAERLVDWAGEFAKKHRLDSGLEILISAVHGKVALKELANWIMGSDIPFRLQPQLHKIIWGESEN